jgi:hypothetical protein
VKDCLLASAVTERDWCASSSVRQRLEPGVGVVDDVLPSVPMRQACVALGVYAVRQLHPPETLYPTPFASERPTFHLANAWFVLDS